LKIGCCGFPVGRDRYFSELDAVEIESSFYKLPKPSTAERWGQEKPKGFSLTLKAWQLITHAPDCPTYEKLGRKIPDKLRGRYGHFRRTDEVADAWAQTAAIARLAGAEAVLFQTPPAFYQSADSLRDLYSFFKSAPRHGLVLAWEPRGNWDDKLVERACRELELIRAGDPLRTPPSGRWVYARLHGPPAGRRFELAHLHTEPELKRVLAAVDEKPGWVFFNNKAMWDDARRLKALSVGAPGGRWGRR
jgi:uncharacterized protein YecE (DUF72 family)